jgi:SpoVK/Ycf46/Vps4 family AAA+-type ATPase
MVKRIYVPLPDAVAREALIIHLMKKHGAGGLNVAENKPSLARIVHMTQGYSGSDLNAVSHQQHADILSTDLS